MTCIYDCQACSVVCAQSILKNNVECRILIYDLWWLNNEKLTLISEKSCIIDFEFLCSMQQLEESS